MLLFGVFIGGEMNWRELNDAPLETFVLLAWGSNASGPMGIEIAKQVKGVWRDQQDERVEADGYRAFAWMPLPDLPNARISSEA
jgi:hypothetical protein